MTDGERQFGPFTLLERLGQGGMAVTYRARERMEGIDGARLVALKQILPHFASDESFRKMFLDEARLSMQLNHQNICRTHTAGEYEDTLFIAMEFIDGLDLAALMDRARELPDGVPLAHALFIIEQVLRGLEAAHGAQGPDGAPLSLVHRDVSPQNIRISRRGEVKIIDFGVAKAQTNNAETLAGMVKGKVLYLSPEQLDAKPLDGRSDLFAVGLVLYELITAEHPLRGDSEVATIYNHYNKPIEPPESRGREVPPSVSSLVMKALSREPEDRFATAGAMARAITDALFEVFPSYRPYLFEDFVTWALSDDPAETYELPDSVASSTSLPISANHEPRRAAATIDERVARVESSSEPPPRTVSRSTYVEAQLPKDVQHKAQALYGDKPKNEPPHGLRTGPSGAYAQTAHIAPPRPVDMAGEDRGSLWRPIAVFISIVTLAAAWIVFLMVTSAM